MLHKKLKDKKIILASGSPRRQFLLKEINVDYTVEYKTDIDESFPPHLKNEEIALYLAELKAKANSDLVKDNVILITADTIVLLKDEVISKPVDRDDAIYILKKLSGNMHRVITAICLVAKDKKRTFFSESQVFFKTLTEEEIIYYIDNYKPYDKAGAYGIQEWIGYVAIERIEGSFFNVMGLPVQKLYHELLDFIKN